MSDQEPPVSRWLVRKSDGTELRFPSLDALKSYILSGVVTSGDVVAPEDASWARIEDLAELSALMGMIAPPKSPPDAPPFESPEAAPQPTDAAEAELDLDSVLDNIPDDRTGCEGIKRDDLRHSITPVALRDVFNHVISTIHAEINIEIWH